MIKVKIIETGEKKWFTNNKAQYLIKAGKAVLEETDRQLRPGRAKNYQIK